MSGTENLTIKHIEDEYHVSRPTVARWLSKGVRGRGRLPSMLVGGRRLIRREDLEKWIVYDGGGEMEPSGQAVAVSASEEAEKARRTWVSAELDRMGV